MSADEKVNDIFVEQLNVDKDKVVPNISFLDDLNADSLKLVELIMVAGTGQKDIIHQIKSQHQRTGDINAA
ncbi:MAG: acyl carrier protein [Thermodesulfobacteriota bacterium]|jgi:acyl carrier protein